MAIRKSVALGMTGAGRGALAAAMVAQIKPELPSEPVIDVPPSGSMKSPSHYKPGSREEGLAIRAERVTMFGSDAPPERLSVDRDSLHFNEAVARHVNVWFKGTQRKNVVEYCIPERWVLLQRKDMRGRPLFKKGKHVIVTLQGDVEVKWKEASDYAA